jgi:hypothetical protein
MAESPERVGRVRRIVSLVTDEVDEVEEDAKDRLAGTNAVEHRRLERVAKNAMIAASVLCTMTWGRSENKQKMNARARD